MATPSILQKLGSKAKDLKDKYDFLPGDSEVQGLKAIQQNVNSTAMGQPGEQTAPATSSADKNNPMTRYGSRPGEIRYNVDIDGNLTPVQSTPAAPAPAAKPGMRPIAAPTYDQGGEVKKEDANIPAKATPKSMVKEEMDVDTGKPASRLPELVPAIKPTPLAPLYDEGGDVDVNDGKHQVAVLEDGERVLTPEQNEQYKKEHGAPADFGGPVLPNPKGLKPILDTEIKPETERLSGGAKMSTDNAPLKTPKGDVSNPLPADIAPEQGREISTGLKPYSQAMDEKQKAKDKVNNPGVQTLDAEPIETEVKPRGGTPEEQKAVDTDIKNAMGQGVAGMTQLGLAKLHEKLLRPTEEKGALEQGATAPPGLNGGPNAPDAATQGAPAGPGLPKLGGPAATTPPAAPAPLDRKATIADYDKKIAAALDLATPEGQEQAERLANAKQEFIHRNPWGSVDNHPGVLGKLGHVAEEVGARLPIISSVVNQIPGSEGARNAEHNATLGQIEKDTPLTTAREAEENTADKNSAAKKPKYEMKETMDNRPDSPTYGKPVWAGVNETDPTDVKYNNAEAVVKGTGVATGQENKDAFQKVLAKIGTPEAADPGKQMDALNAAKESGKITPEEYTASVGYLGANPAPATQAAGAGEKAAAANKEKLKGKYFTWSDEEGTHFGTGDKMPEGAESTEVDGKTFMNEARTGNVVQKSMNQIAKDVDEHPEIWDNAAARNILATTLEQIDRTSSGLMIAGTGGNIPLPSGMGDMLNTALQNKALDEKTGRAVKDYIADYKSMKDKVISMQMALQGGKIGRGSAQAFKAIADQIPNGSTPDSKTARRQMSNLFTTQQDLMSNYPERYQNFEKEKPYTMTSGEPQEGQTQQHAGFTYKYDGTQWVKQKPQE
jgi:hypothetical protein